MAISWLKKGAESVQVAKQEAVAQEIRKEEAGGMFRFWLKVGEDKVFITFVDGELDAQGFLVPPRYYEHNLFLDGHYGNHFVCPEKTAPQLGEHCPICATGDRPQLMSLFTVIDHRQFPSTKEPGKIYKDGAKLFVANTQAMETLNKIAVKRNGLAGCTFEVSRVGDKSPRVGSMFDFEKKTPIDELVKQYMQEVVDPKTNAKSMVSIFVPADYEKEIIFRTGEQLAAKGFGAPQVSGYGSGSNTPAEKAEDAPPTDYASQL
jgi:hypothetical protein